MRYIQRHMILLIQKKNVAFLHKTLIKFSRLGTVNRYRMFWVRKTLAIANIRLLLELFCLFIMRFVIYSEIMEIRWQYILYSFLHLLPFHQTRCRRRRPHHFLLFFLLFSFCCCLFTCYNFRLYNALTPLASKMQPKWMHSFDLCFVTVVALFFLFKYTKTKLSLHTLRLEGSVVPFLVLFVAFRLYGRIKYTVSFWLQNPVIFGSSRWSFQFSFPIFLLFIFFVHVLC